MRTTVRTGSTGPSGAISVVSLGTLAPGAPVGLGTISYRCSRGAGGGLITARLGGRTAATETVYVEGDGRRHLRSGTLQPAAALALAGVPGRTLRWHIIQSTEGFTLDGVVTVAFRGAGTGGAGCASAAWRSFVGVISHAGKWSPPRGWL